MRGVPSSVWLNSRAQTHSSADWHWFEDALTYDEPPDWMQPTRHTLGAVLLRAGLGREAEAVYREDLVRFPENGWSLWGLKRALEMRGAADEAAEVARRFETAWKRADVKLDTTCFCLPGL